MLCSLMLLKFVLIVWWVVVWYWLMILWILLIDSVCGLDVCMKFGVLLFLLVMNMFMFFVWSGDDDIGCWLLSKFVWFSWLMCYSCVKMWLCVVCMVFVILC